MISQNDPHPLTTSMCSHSFVEEFFEGWLRMLKAQNNKVEVKDGGSSAPALTYNDETEAAVRTQN